MPPETLSRVLTGCEAERPIAPRRSRTRAPRSPLTKEALREALENPSHRERRVLELHHGLGDECPQTLDDVGRTFNVPRERVRQIEMHSLKHLPTWPRRRASARMRDRSTLLASRALEAVVRATGIPVSDGHRDEKAAEG